MSTDIIKAENLIFKSPYYSNETSHPFNFSCKAGEIGVIPNGKIGSQIGRLIWNNGTILSGELLFHSDLNHNNVDEAWKKNVGFGFREKGVLATQSVYQNVNLPVKYYHGDEQLTKIALEDINIDAKNWNLRPHLVSWQIRKKTLIARAAVLNPKFIFLDDPLTLLDQDGKKDFHHWLNKQKQKGIAILIGTDDIHTGLIWADWILNEKNCADYDFKKNYSANQNEISKLLKLELLEGII